MSVKPKLWNIICAMCKLLHHLTKWPTSEQNQVCLIWECESYFTNRASFWWRNTYSILSTNVSYTGCCIKLTEGRGGSRFCEASSLGLYNVWGPLYKKIQNYEFRTPRRVLEGALKINLHYLHSKFVPGWAVSFEHSRSISEWKAQSSF